MAQLRQRKAELEEIGASVFCVVPGDDSRALVFQEKSAGPFRTLCDPAGRAGAIYGVTKMFTGVDWASARSLFVIDRNGIIRYSAEHYMAGGPPRGLDVDAVLREARSAAGF